MSAVLKAALSGKTLSEVQDRVVVAEIVNQGDKLILPENCSLDEAIALIERRKKFMTETVSMSQSFEVSPLDGAHALDRVLTSRYGWTDVGPTPGFWGPEPPRMISVEVSLGVFRNVPWGSFKLPGINGKITSGYSEKEGRIVFALNATVLRANEDEVTKLFDALREYLKTGSIYRGKALRVRFTDNNGANLDIPEIRFIDTDVDETKLVYSKAVQSAIETNLFTPIKRFADLNDHGIPFKRGVMLGGAFGTGKTLAAKVASKFAVEAGITYIYVPRADELREALEFAKLYQSPGAVIFCEDVDRVLAGERSIEMDDILNIIDGVDTKTCPVMIVLTTNELGEINQAMLRPGRLDAVIEVTAPDAEAVQKLLRVYGGSSIAPDEDLSEAGAELAGQIPATIAEVVRRATLSQLALNRPGERVTSITGAALADAARTMSRQLALLNRPTDKTTEPSITDAVVKTVDKAVDKAVNVVLNGARDKINAIHAKVC